MLQPNLTDDQRHRVLDDLLKRKATVGIGEWKGCIKQKSGRKTKDRAEIARIRAVPVEERKPHRRHADAAGLSKHLVQALIREGVLKVHSTRIKPYLSGDNKHRRIEHAPTFIGPTTLMFEPMYDIVHVDEKWFHEDDNTRSCFIFDGETALQRSR
ncbi:hypothetical protein L915_01816 [Phytophthora nicotianae]|uniref:Transposase Tc1-like domain-containing protein n=1 Tax=Phytophthora nicotianae TaxID=4792 RepID=W2HJD1_PHYNI|nr:hypothetical protein L915_01816 [Phytophthora nicotianae]